MKEIKFVDVGEGITEGHVQKWLVKDADDVKEDQPVVQVETDKAIVNAPAPVSGKIKINIPENSTVHVGDVLAYIGTESELSSLNQQKQPQPAQPKPNEQDKTSQPQQGATNVQKHEVLATPYIRKLARDYNIDLSTVAGTGPGGRILENDLKSHASKQQQSTAPKFSEILEQQHSHEIERVAMSQTRKTIAKNMELSLSVPAAVHMDIIDARPLYEVETKRKKEAAEKNVHLTFLPFIIKATAQALKENPLVNSSYDRDRQEIILKKYYNIGLAAEAKDGLKVVVIKDAGTKNIIDIANEIQGFHKKLEENTITIEEMRDSTFTITNIGSLGGGFLSVPIINYPEVAILGVHMIKDAPIAENGKIVIGKELPLSLSFDHRVIDGADAARFVNSIKKYLQDRAFLEGLS